MIRIVRLQNGEDIVANIINKETGGYTVQEPMTVNIDYRHREAGLVMQHWLPVQLIQKNEIELAEKDVMCILEPAEEFCEYYLNTVEKIKELLSARNLVDSMDDEEVNNIMDAYEELEQHGSTLH